MIMEPHEQTKTKPLSKGGEHPPDGIYVFRCPNPGCGKTHFSVIRSAISGSRFNPLCPNCGKNERALYHIVYESVGMLQLRAFCGVCQKEHIVSYPGIHRICERCGWEGDFFLGF